MFFNYSFVFFEDQRDYGNDDSYCYACYGVDGFGG
jgi:hypothetical protein